MKSTALLLIWLLIAPISLYGISESNHFVRDPQLNHASFTTNNQKALQAVRIDHSGVLHATDVLKQKLASDLKLPLRDLRIVDPSFPSQIQATFIARPNAIIFALENIKVVVKHNEAIIFSPRQAEVEEYIPALQLQVQAIQSGTAAHTTTPGSTLVPRTVSMRFEHMVIEAALNVVCNNLFRKVRALSPAIQAALQGLQAESRGLDIIKTQVDELLPLKNQLDELKKRVQEVDRAIKEVLDNDEDMGMMHLEGETSGSGFDGGDSAAIGGAGVGGVGGDGSDVVDAMTAGVETTHTSENTIHDTHPAHASHTHSWLRHKSPLKPHTRHSKAHPLSDSIHHTHATLNAQLTSHLHARHQDATISFEMMLENYLNEIGWIASEVEEMSDQITNTEENVALQIDLLRNRILRFELSLSMCSFIVSCAALVTGVFGMNLLSHVEHQPVLFWAVSVALVVGMGVTYGQLRSYGRREKLF